nr:C248 [uncultured bacterium]
MLQQVGQDALRGLAQRWWQGTEGRAIRGRVNGHGVYVWLRG